MKLFTSDMMRNQSDTSGKEKPGNYKGAVLIHVAVDASYSLRRKREL